jgi:hypothetical protein
VYGLEFRVLAIGVLLRDTTGLCTDDSNVEGNACLLELGPELAQRGLGGRFKSRNLSTIQIPHFRAATETGEFYFAASSVRKSVCTFVRQLRGPQLSTCA